ncbi:MAG: aminopeptidase [Bryobacteraceae bacterium]|nr:aminopeptidase [Bryobacteraceae bacterium]
MNFATFPFDPELTPGARNAIRTCLRVDPSERVTIITDVASQEIAAALVREIEEVGAPYAAFRLEDYEQRPSPNMPAPILADMELSTVSIFAAVAQQNELHSRMQMTDVVNRRKMRHAHMVNIEKRIMMQGMRADFLKVDELTAKIRAIGAGARYIHAKTAHGTDITARMNPDYKWIKTSGIISTLKWGNLPGGETFTTPGEVNGVFVIDGVVGDYLCAKYGDLRDNPLTIEIKGNRLVSAESKNRELRDEFWEYTHRDENSDRVGEFAIGTNLALDDVIGNILQDEKIPGVHIAFGNPYGVHTGADWYSSTHIDVVGRQFDIWADERQIMHAGKFSADLMPAAA